MYQVNVAEAEHNLSRLIEKALAGEEVIITRDNRPLIRFEVVPAARSKRRIGGAKGLIKNMAEDFDAPLMTLVLIHGMKLLLDTHALLWIIDNDPRLSATA